MALFNEIQAGRFNRFVQQLLSIKGQPPMPTVASDLQFIHAFFSGYENMWIQGWDAFFIERDVTASAGNFQALEVRNPSGSNVLAVIERAFASAAVADIFNTNFSTNNSNQDQPSVRSAVAIDTRGRTGSSIIVSDNQGAAPGAIGNNNIQLSVNTTTTVPYIDFLRQGEEVLLMPGTSWALTNTNLAQLCHFAFRWRERALEDSERKR